MDHQEPARENHCTLSQTADCVQSFTRLDQILTDWWKTHERVGSACATPKYASFSLKKQNLAGDLNFSADSFCGAGIICAGVSKRWAPRGPPKGGHARRSGALRAPLSPKGRLRAAGGGGQFRRFLQGKGPPAVRGSRGAKGRGTRAPNLSAPPSMSPLFPASAEDPLSPAASDHIDPEGRAGGGAGPQRVDPRR